MYTKPIINLEYLEGGIDPQYGGIITNICKLPVGTEFYVRNGCWKGKICEDNIGLYIKIGGCEPRRFKKGDKEYLSIDFIKGYHDKENKKMQIETIIKNVVNPCSICKNKNTECNECEISKDNIIPNNFLADTFKITPFFVDSYYELLNMYIQLLHKLGLETKIEPVELGE